MQIHQSETKVFQVIAATKHKDSLSDLQVSLWHRAKPAIFPAWLELEPFH